MRTTRAALLIVVIVLAAPAAAPAKGIKAVTVCGASGCRGVHDSEDQQWILGGSQPVNPPGVAAPFYEVRVEVGGEGFSDHWTSAYLPSLHYMRGSDENGDPAWTVVQSPQGLRALGQATRGLRAFPASRLGALGPKNVTGANVVEVYEPARDAAVAGDAGGGGSAWIWLAAAAGALGLGGLALTARRRIRKPTPPSTPPSAAGTAPR